MRKKISIVVAIVLSIIFALTVRVEAASIGMSINKSSADVGDSFSVTVSGINGKVTISGNSNVTVSPSGTQFVEGSLTITGTAKSAGTGTVTVTPIDVTTTGADPVEITSPASKSITIKAKEETKPKEDNNTGNTSSDPKQNPGTEPQKKQEEETKSGEYHLSSLSTSVGTLKPSFNTYNQDYTLEFPADYDMSELKSIDVSAKATHSKASVSGTGAFEVKEGDNEIIVNCTAENGKVLAYRIKFKKEVKTQQSDLRLKTFSITKLRSEDNKQVLAKLNEEFKPDVFEYTMDLDEETKELNIDYEIEEKFKDKINVEITGNKDLKPGENIITIKLTSKDDEKVTTTYTIRVNKAGAVEETVPETKTSGSLNIKLIIIIVGSIVGLLVLILIILLIVNHIQKKKAKESMKADDDNNFVGGDNGFDADIGHDIKPVGVAGLDEESDSNYDYLGRDEESEDDEDDEKRFGAAGYNTIHQHYDEDIEDDEGYAGFDDTDLPEGTVSEHMINAKLNGEADELKRRYEIDELQEEIADELKDKKTKRKGRGRRFK